MAEAFGIDFGTTNSGAVGFDRGQMANFGYDTRQPFPSVVAIHRLNGEVRAVGRDARERQEELAETCEIIKSVKTHLGDPAKIWNFGRVPWTPERVTAELLRALWAKVRAARTTGERPAEAVFSIPVGFAPRKRQALRRAAEMAGIRVKSFVSEPTAAVCKNFSKVRRFPTVVVFDWGGGTLDISVVRIEREHVHELATFGVALGGDDIDRRIARYVHGQIAVQRQLDVPFEAVDPRSRDRLMARVEAAKCDLARKDSVEIRLNLYHGQHDVTCPLSATTLRQLLLPEYERVWEALAATVQERARASFKEIGCVLMVGGSSRLRGLLDYLYDRAPDVDFVPADVEADWNIAQGAAVISATPGRHVIARDLGLSVCDGSFVELLRAGDPVDHAVIERHFGLVDDEREARFVFALPRRHEGADGDAFGHETVGHLSVPAFGFSDEPILLQTRITEDLVVEVKGRSAHRGRSGQAAWTFEKLPFRYQMPENA